MLVAIIQARMGSSRLPGKSMMPIAGQPMIRHVIDRTVAIPQVDKAVLATSLSSKDDLVAREAAKAGIACYRGSEHDVLDRMTQAAKSVGASAVMRITGDCPLLATDVAAITATAFLDGSWDFVSNDTLRSGYPDGTDVEVFSMRTLIEANARACKGHDREHVTVWMRRNLTYQVMDNTEFLPYNWSVDDLDDLVEIRQIYACMDGSMEDHPRLGPEIYSLRSSLRAYRKAGLGV